MNFIDHNISEKDFEEAARVVGLYGWDREKRAQMTDTEKWKLKRSLNLVQRVGKAVAKDMKQAEIDGQDWEKIIRESRKRFTWLDIAILETLEDGEYYLSYAGIEDRLEGHLRGNQAMPIKGIHTIRLRTRRLMRMGLVKFQRGLFTEDGEVAGSGFALGKHADKARRIVAAYYPPENERLDVQCRLLETSSSKQLR